MTEMNRERREAISQRIMDERDFRNTMLSHEDILALLSDSAWRERVERKMEELVKRWDERARVAGHNEGGGKVRQCATELRAIVDTGRGEGDEG